MSNAAKKLTPERVEAFYRKAARIIEVGARSPEDVFEGMAETERLAWEKTRLAKTWIDETGELVSLA